MSSFGRVLRLSFRYPYTFLASFLFALGVAVLWGGNIGALFPFLKVAFQGQGLQEWVAVEIRDSDRRIQELGVRLDGLERELAAVPAEQHKAVVARIAAAETRRTAEQKALAWYRMLQPYVNRYLPPARFSRWQ